MLANCPQPLTVFHIKYVGLCFQPEPVCLQLCPLHIIMRLFAVVKRSSPKFAIPVVLESRGDSTEWRYLSSTALWKTMD